MDGNFDATSFRSGNGEYDGGQMYCSNSNESVKEGYLIGDREDDSFGASMENESVSEQKLSLKLQESQRERDSSLAISGSDSSRDDARLHAFGLSRRADESTGSFTSSRHSREDSHSGSGSGSGGENSPFSGIRPQLEQQQHSPCPSSRPASNRLSLSRRVNSYVSDFGSMVDDLDGRKVLRGHDVAVSAVAVFIGKGHSLILSGDESSAINVWSLLLNEPMATLRGHTAKVSSLVALSAEGIEPLAISGSWDETIRIWPMSFFLSAEYDHREIAGSVHTTAAVVIDNLKSRVLSLSTLCVPGQPPLVAAGTAGRTIHLYALPAGELKYSLHDPDHLNWNLCVRAYLVPGTLNNTRDDSIHNYNSNSKSSGLHGPIIVSGCKNNCVRVWSLPIESIVPVEAPHGKETEEATPAAIAGSGAVSEVVATVGIAASPSQDVVPLLQVKSKGILGRRTISTAATAAANDERARSASTSAGDSRLWSQSRAMQRMLRADSNNARDLSDAGKVGSLLMQRNRSLHQGQSRLPLFRSASSTFSDAQGGQLSSGKQQGKPVIGRYGYRNYNRGTSISSAISVGALLSRSKSEAPGEFNKSISSSALSANAAAAASDTPRSTDLITSKRQGSSFFGLSLTKSRSSNADEFAAVPADAANSNKAATADTPQSTDLIASKRQGSGFFGLSLTKSRSSNAEEVAAATTTPTAADGQKNGIGTESPHPEPINSKKRSSSFFGLSLTRSRSGNTDEMSAAAAATTSSPPCKSSEKLVPVPMTTSSIDFEISSKKISFPALYPSAPDPSSKKQLQNNQLLLPVNSSSSSDSAESTLAAIAASRVNANNTGIANNTGADTNKTNLQKVDRSQQSAAKSPRLNKSRQIDADAYPQSAKSKGRSKAQQNGINAATGNAATPGGGDGDFWGKAYSKLNKRKAKQAELLYDEPLRTLAHPSRVHGVVIYRSDEDVHIASICRDSAIRIWSLDGELVKIVQGQNSPLSWLSAYDAGADKSGGSGSGSILVGGSIHGDIRLWYHGTGELLKVFHGHADEVTSMCVFLKDSVANINRSVSGGDIGRHMLGAKKKSVSKQSELFIVSASKDTTVRTWKVSNEKTLKVLQHAPGVCVTCMEVFAGSDVVVVTGADDGRIRGWLLPSSSTYEQDDTMLWSSDAHPRQRVRALALYTPHNSGGSDTNSLAREQLNHLDEPFVVSTGENGSMIITSVTGGDELMEMPADSSASLTSLVIYNGPQFCMDPILITGSCDTLVRVYSLVNFERLFVLDGHNFDVTALAVYAPALVDTGGGGGMRSRRSNGSFGPSFVEDTALPLVQQQHSGKLFSPDDVVIISGSIDNTVRVWQQTTGANVGAMECPGHITCLAAIDLPKQPLLIAGDSEGEFHIWSLYPPYLFLRTLQSYAQDVEVIAVHNVEGRFPVLVGGHLDGSNSVWNLSTFEVITVLEGHSSQVTALRVFSKGGGSISALASGSSDGTIRVVFDFLDAVPDAGKIMHLFNSDLSGENSYLVSRTDKSKSRWPRMTEAVQQVGAEEFFNIYFYLFKHAVRSGRPDFLEEFLPKSRAGLINSHNSALVGHRKGLLDVAIGANSAKAVRIIVNCWSKLFSNPPLNDQDIIYQVNFEELNDTMLLLAEFFPLDYERLVCAAKPIRVRYNNVPAFKHFLLFNKRIRKMRMATVPETGPVETDEFFFYPVPYFATGQTLMAFESVCKKLDSVEIFKSEAGKMVLLYAWNNFGRTAHFYTMLVYVLFVVSASCELLLFHRLREQYSAVIYALMACELAFDAFSAYEEVFQLDRDVLWYFLHVWNAVDVIVIAGNVTGVVLRLLYWRDTLASRIVLSITIVLAWFNLLQFLRAYESTGPLVSMILKTASDIKYLMFVLLLFVIGFSLAFWILTTSIDETVFGRFDQALLHAFSFMLGEYDVTVFDGAALQSVLACMSVLYMLIVAILLLNLLIALMGNSYSNVQTKGVAQWRLERAKICVDMEPSSFAPRAVLQGRYAKLNAVLYVRKGEDEEDSLRGHLRAGSSSSAPADESLQLLKQLIATQGDMKSAQSQLHTDLLAVRSEVTELRVQNRLLQDALQRSTSASASMTASASSSAFGSIEDSDYDDDRMLSVLDEEAEEAATAADSDDDDYEEEEVIPYKELQPLQDDVQPHHGDINHQHRHQQQPATSLPISQPEQRTLHSDSPASVSTTSSFVAVGSSIHYSQPTEALQRNFDDLHDAYFAGAANDDSSLLPRGESDDL